MSKAQLYLCRYDFDLRTGQSETGLKACTYRVQIVPDEENAETVWVEAPEGGSDWKLVELRPVSEGLCLAQDWRQRTECHLLHSDFADPPPPPPDLSHLAQKRAPAAPESIIPADNPPKTLMEWAVLILNTADPTLKVRITPYTRLDGWT